jgi:hypothetical protein
MRSGFEGFRSIGRKGMAEFISRAVRGDLKSEMGRCCRKSPQTASRLISRRKTNHAMIVRRCAPRPVTKVTGDFITLDRRAYGSENLCSALQKDFRQDRSSRDLAMRNNEVRSSPTTDIIAGDGQVCPRCGRIMNSLPTAFPSRSPLPVLG